MDGKNILAIKHTDPGTYGDTFGFEFQQHILAVLARTPGYILRFRPALDSTYFSFDVLRPVAKALLAHVDKYKHLPTRITLFETVKSMSSADKLPLVEATIKKLYAEDISDAESVKDKTIEFGRLMAAVNASLANAEDLDKGDRSKILDRIQKAMQVGNDLMAKGVVYHEITVEERTELYQKELDGVDLIPTGMTHLDMMLRGGAQKGELFCGIALPKFGKTTFLVNVGFGALISPRCLKVAHITCEISRAETVKRYDDRWSGSALALRSTNPKRYAEIIDTKLKNFRKGELRIEGFARKALTPSRLRSLLEIWRQDGFDVECLVLDYADEMKPDKQHQGEWWRDGIEIFGELKTIAGEYNCAVWTVNQVTGANEEKEIWDAWNIAGGKEKIAVVDGLIGLMQTREEYGLNRFRIEGTAIRGRASHQMVHGIINRGQCRMTTQALFDASGNLVSGQASDEMLMADSSKKNNNGNGSHLKNRVFGGNRR